MNISVYALAAWNRSGKRTANWDFCHRPLSWLDFPLFLRFVQDQIQEFGRRLIGWGDVTLRAPRGVAWNLRLNSIRGVDDPPQVIRKGEGGNALRLGTPPHLTDGREYLALEAGLECAQSSVGDLIVNRRIERNRPIEAACREWPGSFMTRL